MIPPSFGTDATTVFDVRDIRFAYANGGAHGGDPRHHGPLSLDRVSLTIRQGERVVILGANGSGKSTLLKILDGLYFPAEGSIAAFGRPLTERALRDDAFNFAFRRAVGLVFQDSDVQLFSPSVWDEVAFAPLQLGLSHAEVGARVEAALAGLRIEHLRSRAPHRLSGGEKKRVAIASVLSLDPAVWLLDEPTAGLDPRSQGWLVDFLVSQSRRGKTIVAATHDLDIVETIADRVVLLDEGHRLVADCTPAEALADRALLAACNLVRESQGYRVGWPVPSNLSLEAR
jgi:cobalt/nickel transport system ATP-binding protein